MAKNLYKYTWIVALWSITIFSGRTAAAQQQNPKHTTNQNLHTLQICNATGPRPMSRATTSHNWIILSAYLHTLWLYPVWLKLFSGFPPGSPQLPEILIFRARISPNSRVLFFSYPDLPDLQRFWFSPPRSAQPPGVVIFPTRISPTSRSPDFPHPDLPNLQES